MLECELNLSRMTEEVGDLHIRDCILVGVEALPLGTRSTEIHNNLLG